MALGNTHARSTVGSAGPPLATRWATDRQWPEQYDRGADAASGWPCCVWPGCTKVARRSWRLRQGRLGFLLMLLKGAAATGIRTAALLAILTSLAPASVTPPLPPSESPAFPRLADGPRVAVPSTIDATGRTDASAKLRAFIARVPDRSTIVFKKGGTYKLDQAIRIEGRRRLTFDGEGAILRMAGCEINDSAFVVDRQSVYITIREFLMVGDNADGGTVDAFHAGCESQSGVAVYSGRFVEIADVSVIRTNGECVYVDAGGSDYTWSEHVWFHDSVCKLNGRMGVAIAAASNVVVERVHFYRVGLFVLDIEPYTVDGGATYTTFRNNTVMEYGMSPEFTPWFVAAEGTPGSTVHDLVVTGNRVMAGAPRSANTITDAGLATTIRVERRQRVVFTNNSTSVQGSGPALFFSHVDGLTVTNNDQPLTKGSIARFVDCSGVRFE